MLKPRIVIVNNTGEDLRMFHRWFMDVANGSDLPEALRDIFKVKRFVEDDEVRVIVDWF